MFNEVFSHLCGRSSPLFCDGEPLPVCARCFGFYLAATATMAWLLATGLWRRGLPSWSIFLLHVGLLLAALAGGLHLFGQTPALKVLLGAWAGHVFACWLAGGSAHLFRLATRRPQLPWRSRDRWNAAAALATVSVGALGVALLCRRSAAAWSIAAFAGLVAVSGMVVIGLAAIATWAIRRVR